MTAVFVLSIIFGSIIVGLAIIGGTILMVIKYRHGGVSREDRERRNEETKMIQDIYRGLNSMEKRVEALETILMDLHGKEKQHE
jgi:phage shock protein B